MPSVLAIAEQGASWTGDQLSKASARVWAVLSSETQKAQPSHKKKRWQLSALPPKASPPPSPLLPSEIKYSASLVRGQAVVHGVLGIILFTFGVLGSHRWAASTCVPGLACGVAGVAAGVCGELAHKIWYKNWAIKSFLISSAAVVIASLLALVLTFYFTLSSPAAVETHALYESFTLQRLDGDGREEEQQEVIDAFFEVPTPPPSKSLVGNMVVGLLLQLLVSLWSALTAWRGVRADEFTPRRREELLKQIMATAPARKGPVNTEGVDSMPLAALYQLLQTHPELLQGAVPQRPASRHSMDYRERVCRYLSEAHAADPISTQGNGSPTPCHSRASKSKKQPATDSATDTKMTSTQSKDSAKSQSRERLPSPSLSANCHRSKISSPTSLSLSSSSSPVLPPKLEDSSDHISSSAQGKNVESAVEVQPSSETASPIEKSPDFDKSSNLEKAPDSEKSFNLKQSPDSEKSSNLENSHDFEKSSNLKKSPSFRSDGGKSCEINEPSESEKSPEINESAHVGKPCEIKERNIPEKAGADDKVSNLIQPQSLVLGTKTLPPLSMDLIKPSDLVPKRVTQQIRRSSVGAKFSPSVQGDSECNNKFRSTLDRPPPKPRKEYGRPKLLLNADVHRMLKKSEKQINGRPRQSRSVSDLGDINRNFNLNKINSKNLPDKELNEVKIHLTDSCVEDQPLKSNVSLQSEVISVSKSRDTSNPPRIHKKKDRKPPPIPVTKENLVQGSANKREETSEPKLTTEANISNVPGNKCDEISTTPDTKCAPVSQKEHLEHDQSGTDVRTERKRSFSGSPSLQTSHVDDSAAPLSVPSSDSGVSSVLSSDDNVSTEDPSPPESHVSIDDDNLEHVHTNDCEKSLGGDSGEAALPSQKSDTPAQTRGEGNVNEDGEGENQSIGGNISAPGQPVKSHVERKPLSSGRDEDKESITRPTESTFLNEDTKNNLGGNSLTKLNDLNSEADGKSTTPNSGDHLSAKSSLHSSTQLEKNGDCQTSPGYVRDEEESETREVPFVKSVILKNKDYATDRVQGMENKKQLSGQASGSLPSLQDFSRTTTDALKPLGANSLPATGSKDVKISFRSLRNETSIPTSFGSIKNNKSFEQILGAILSKAHNLTASKPAIVPDPKKSSKLQSTKAAENQDDTQSPDESQVKEKKESSANARSNNLSRKSLNIEIRPYESRNIREEIKSLKN